MLFTPLRRSRGRRSGIKDESNWGKVLNPAVNSLAHNVVDAIHSGVKIDNCVCTDVESKADTIENLYEFGKAFGITDLVNKADIQRPVHTEVSQDSEIEYDDLDEGEAPSWKETMHMYMRSVGCYYHKGDTPEECGIYFCYKEDKPAFMRYLSSFLKGKSEKATGNQIVDVYAVKDDNTVYSTGIKVSRDIYPELIKVYTVAKSRF